jgi:hypothetical protein
MLKNPDSEKSMVGTVLIVRILDFSGLEYTSFDSPLLPVIREGRFSSVQGQDMMPP